jgi:hypothetical protein
MYVVINQIGHFLQIFPGNFSGAESRGRLKKHYCQHKTKEI